MKKKATIYFSLFLGIILFSPWNTKALENIKTCNYKNTSNDITINIYEDYSAEATLKKLNGNSLSQKTTVSNWNEIRSYIKTTSNASCPKYTVVGTNNSILVSNNQSAANQLASSQGTIISLSKEKINGTSNKEELLNCKYNYQSSGKNVDLIYHVFSDDSIGLAFSNSEILLGDNVPWYHGASFGSTFLNSSKVSKNTYTCPTLSIEKTATGITVFPKEMAKESCNGECASLKANKVTISEEAKAKDVVTKKVTSSCIGPAIGVYESKKYFFPYFRSYSDGTMEWSIDGKNYTPETGTMVISTGVNETAKIGLNESLLSSVYKNKKVTCPSEIYRCVSSAGSKTYNYELSTSGSNCSKNELGATDGQALGSTSYQGALGDPETDNKIETKEDMQQWMEGYNGDVECNSLLGDVNRDDTVAWLLQKILNYLKILGPLLVLVLSSMDFAKSIIQSDEENMKKAQKRLIIRLVLAATLFFIPDLVNVLLTIFGITTNQTCGLK